MAERVRHVPAACARVSWRYRMRKEQTREQGRLLVARQQATAVCMRAGMRLVGLSARPRGFRTRQQASAHTRGGQRSAASGSTYESGMGRRFITRGVGDARGAGRAGPFTGGRTGDVFPTRWCTRVLGGVPKGGWCSLRKTH